MPRVHKFSKQKVAPNVLIRYQSYDGYSIEKGGETIGQLENFSGGNWAVDLPHVGVFTFVKGFENAKALLRAKLAEHYPVKEAG